MYCIRNVTKNIYFVGGSDRRLALFENIFPIERGVSYNSYFIDDDKTVLVDGVDSSIADLFFDNLFHVLAGRSLDYMIINHLEPDHGFTIKRLASEYPNLTFIINAKMVPMLKQFFNLDTSDRFQIVKEGDEFTSGSHTFTFVMAPLVHWPEVMMTYEKSEKILFSADAFGTFGALNGALFNDEVNFDRDWIHDARRYYTNIVGKFGKPVQNALSKASTLDIAMICPLHGPIWRSNLSYILEKYTLWSTYKEEDDGVLIVYASMYGNTENAVDILASKLVSHGKHVAIYDVSSTHVSTLIAETFRYKNIVLACPTYNGGIYPVMENYLSDMKALNVQKKTVALIENGTWAPVTARLMTEKLSALTDITILEPVITLKSALHEEGLDALDALAKAF